MTRIERVETWFDADQALKRLGEIEVALERLNGEALVRINEIKEAAKAEADPLNTEKKELEALVKTMCESRKDEFAKQRSRKLTYGEIGYRLVRSVSMPRTVDKVAALIKALKAFGCADCVKVEEKIDRAEVEKLDDATIAKLGLTRRVSDSFRVQPDLDVIREAA